MKKILISTVSFLCLSLMLAAAETPTGVPPLVSRSQVCCQTSYPTTLAARRDARIASRVAYNQALLDSREVRKANRQVLLDSSKGKPEAKVRSRKSTREIEVEQTVKYKIVR